MLVYDDLTYDPTEQMDAHLMVEQALTRLTDDDRRLAVLWAEGYTQREIAAELGLSQPTVHERLEAVFARLRSIIEGGADGA